MKVFTYYSAVPELNVEHEMRLILLWQANWRRHGFEPFVLNEYIASQHPFYAEYRAAVARLPSVNPAHYDYSCYMRHLAMASIGGGVLMDYDVFNRNQAPPESIDMNHLTLWEHICPSLSSGSAEVYLKLCRIFAAYQPDARDAEGGKPHTSDQNILRRIGLEELGIEVRSLVKIYGSDGWDKSPMVHFANSSMGPANLIPRHEHIPGLMGQI